MELFNLSREEEIRLQRALDRATYEIGTLALAHATIVSNTDAKVVIEVKPFFGGASIEEELLARFEHILDPERNAALRFLTRQELDTVFNHFGAERRTITVRHNRAPTDPDKVFVVEDRRASTAGVVTQFTLSSAESDPSMTEHLGALQTLIPSEFY